MTKNEPAVLGGMYEVGVGVADLAAAIGHWQAFGYRVGTTGRLGAAAAERLYGVASAVRSVRLLHQDADHGLVRLMTWDKPTGEGLGQIPLRTPGNRWTVAKTRDVQLFADHARAWKAQGMDLWYLEPVFHPVGVTLDQTQPFRDDFPHKRELPMFWREGRQVLVQRYAHELPNFGRYNEHCLLRASQFTQAGICIGPDDQGLLGFYDQVLGLKRISERRIVVEGGTLPALMMPMRDGELLFETDFDDVRSGPEPDRQLSGKLRVFRLPESAKDDRWYRASAPGNFGYSLYTYRSMDLARLRSKVAGAGVPWTGQVLEDEFGAPAFGCTSPDGYAWAFVQA
ncbi:MAG: hypothetical protein FJX65_07395 [Alphaproteobacteria bacterium]|nr:hypothetical protein [Alphaproteobacteria bacterium]